MPDRTLIEADFTRRRALMLPEAARYETLLKRPKDGKLGAALTAAMEAVEAAFPPLGGPVAEGLRAVRERPARTDAADV